jgi:hypothetical protein
MSIVAALLIAVGMADLCRRRRLPVWLPLPIAPVTVAVIGILAGLSSLAEVLLLLLVAVIAVAWIVLSSRARVYGTGEFWPLLTLIGGVLALILLSGLARPAGGWLADWLAGSPWPRLTDLEPDRLLLVLGLFVIQLSTANELVRQVLAAVGAMKPKGQPQASDQLRGGRLLGPMERIFILGLGLAGEVTAAGLVIAAKGLIRFPELSARRSDSSSINGIGIDEVTEYFLLGSFVSWLISLTAIGLAFLG